MQRVRRQRALHRLGPRAARARAEVDVPRPEVHQAGAARLRRSPRRCAVGDSRAEEHEHVAAAHRRVHEVPIALQVAQVDREAFAEIARQRILCMVTAWNGDEPAIAGRDIGQLEGAVDLVAERRAAFE